MSTDEARRTGEHQGHGGDDRHGWLAMLACCIPMVLAIVLILLFR